MKNEILRLEQIVLYDGKSQILDYAWLNLFRGETIGILGVNYSEKSALVEGIIGARPYDSGYVYINEERVDIRSMKQARNLGIYYINEQSSLIDDFSIVQNMFMVPPEKELIIRKKENRKKTEEILELLGVEVDIDIPVKNLSNRIRLYIEIGRALLGEARVIVLDYVLNGVSHTGLMEVADILKMLSTLHISTILIDTGLPYLKPFCDRIFIMREGRTEAILHKQEVDEEMVLSIMRGGRMDTKIPMESNIRELDQEVLYLKNISDGNTLNHLDLKVYEGEVLGILNVNRRSGKALENLFSGKGTKLLGQILHRGKPVHYETAEQVVRDKILVVPENEYIFPEMTLKENIVLWALEEQKKTFGRMNQSELKYIAGELIDTFINRDKYGIFPDGFVPESRLIHKKVAICRAMSVFPDVLILCNPTKMIDTVERYEIYDDIAKLKDGFQTMIIISSDLRELTVICDRIVTVNKGRVDKKTSMNEKNI